MLKKGNIFKHKYNTFKKVIKVAFRVVKFSVLRIFELLNFWQHLSTVAYKPVAYKKIVYIIPVKSEFGFALCIRYRPNQMVRTSVRKI